MDFKTRLKELRGGLTQKEFAAQLGVSLGAVQHWENGDQLPNGVALIKINEVFGVDINWLLKGDPPNIDRALGARLRNARGARHLYDVSDIIGVGAGNVMKYEAGLIPEREILERMSDYYGCTVDYLLNSTEDGQAVSDTSPRCNPEIDNDTNIVELRHFDVVKDFIDKPLALELNSCLVKLERISPDAYREVGSYIKGVVNGVEIAMKGSGAADPNKAKVG